MIWYVCQVDMDLELLASICLSDYLFLHEQVMSEGDILMDAICFTFTNSGTGVIL